jgi:anti-sigma factor RsiW
LILDPTTWIPERSHRLTPTEEMACNELVEVVTEYLEGKLREEDRLRFEAHLSECPYCADYVEQFRETIAATGELTLDTIPPERRAELVVAFRGWRGRDAR